MNIPATSVSVSAWEDDPQSSPDAAPVPRPVPVLKHPRLGIVLAGEAPAPKRYRRPGPAFRYWNAAESLGRGVRFWVSLVPADVRWPIGTDLTAVIDAGTDLNAYYDRRQICFFHAPVNGDTVYSGESPDVLCHELGHAVLDALVPELWNTASIETAALHEAFGDISAMLAALELESVRTAVAAETRGQLSRSSRLSRLAEQLGWAIRQSHPDAVDRDCLRNAANSFFYAEPESLPPLAPAVVLSSEPHSFSRVFTAAWLDALSGMAGVVRDAAVSDASTSGTTSAGLHNVARDAGALLARAVRLAPIASNYFAQVAAELLRADAALFRGRYRAALQRAFVGRGVLSAESAAETVAADARTGGGNTGRPSRTRRAPGRRPSLPPALVRVPVNGATYGLQITQVVAQGPQAGGGTGIASAAPDLGSLAAATPERASRAFVEDLLRRNRIDPGEFGAPGAARPRDGRTTHALERHGRDIHLVRCLYHWRDEAAIPPAAPGQTRGRLY